MVGAPSKAGTDLNEVGAFLVYPLVASFTFCETGSMETFITITNTSMDPVVAHVSYINGDYWDYTYCYECDFDVPLTGNDTEVLVVTYDQYGTVIESEDGTVSRACPHPFGFVTVNAPIMTGGSDSMINTDNGGDFVLNSTIDSDGGIVQVFSDNDLTINGSILTAGEQAQLGSDNDIIFTASGLIDAEIGAGLGNPVMLADALGRLAPDYREVLVLRHLEGLGFPEIAACMQRTSDNVRHLWVRAVQKLRAELGEPL